MLQDLFMSGKLTDEEYDAARVALVTGHSEVVEDLFRRCAELDKRDPQ